jgi:Protein of unknown function (DUF2442)
MVIEKLSVSTIDEASFAKANERGKKVLARGPLAISARYDKGRIHVELNNGCAFVFPVQQAQGLAGAKITQLRAIEITAAGLSLHWPKLDADLYVPSLVKGVLGTKEWMAQIGASGGKAVTVAKTTASRTNGKLGGRPKKTRGLETV